MSTILPLPSSPHCAPSTAMLVFGIRAYIQSHRSREPRSTRRDRSSRRKDKMSSCSSTFFVPSWLETYTDAVIELDGHSLTLDQLVAIAHEHAPVAITADARARVRAARTVVEEFADHETPAYGINTGFGNFADVRIPHDQLS